MRERPRHILPQPPIKQLHLLTKPPARGTETKILHNAAAVLRGPVDCCVHWGPHGCENGSRNSTMSYSMKGLRVVENRLLKGRSAGHCRMRTERDSGRSRILQTCQRFFGPLDVVGPVTMRIAQEHSLIQCPRFLQMFCLNHHRAGLEGAGGAARPWINCRTERLARHVIAPHLHPRWGCRTNGHDTFKLINDQDQLPGVGGNETALIAFPQRHDRRESRSRCPLKERPTLAPTEEDYEQTDHPAHGHLSETCACSYGGGER